ncbi:MAG: CheR family methyltransferase [Gammaproteobacteria bacterium]
MDTQCTAIEMDVLLYALKKFYHMDFSHYKQASLHRRIIGFMEKIATPSGVELLYQLLKDEKLFLQFLADISVPVTEMFRDPLFFSQLRNLVLPVLNTYPTVKIWIAGCATGEEAFSLAILLHEENMLHKSIIYATDINQMALDAAQLGHITTDDLKKYQISYGKTGGTKQLTDYFDYHKTKYTLRADLMQHIHFHFHNVTTGNYSSGLNLILCRNVFIYFDQQLQNDITGFFMNSLRSGGYLCLGDKESISHSQYTQYFESVCNHEKIFRKRYI